MYWQFSPKSKQVVKSLTCDPLTQLQNRKKAVEEIRFSILFKKALSNSLNTCCTLLYFLSEYQQIALAEVGMYEALFLTKKPP